MNRIFLLLLSTCFVCGVYGQQAVRGAKSQRVIITVDYCYNLLLKNPLSGFFSKNSLPYAMTYIAAHRADKSQDVIVVNLGDSASRVYRFANPYVGVVDTMIRAVGYDSVVKLSDNIRNLLNSQEVSDSIKAFRAVPHNQRGAHILVAQMADNKFNLRSVDITGYYPDKQTVTACEMVTDKLESFFKEVVVRNDNGSDPIDMLYEKGRYADLFHQFQIDRTEADISLFAASNLVKMDSNITFTDIYNLLPYDNQLVTITMTGEQMDRYIEKNYAAKWLTMRTNEDDLLRLTRDEEGHYRTMKAIHNIDDIHGVKMTVNIRRPAEHRVRIHEVGGREFADNEHYVVVTTSFRAAQLIADNIITVDVVRVVSDNYTHDFVAYIRGNKLRHSQNTITVEPQDWLEKAYQREIPFIRKSENRIL